MRLLRYKSGTPSTRSIQLTNHYRQIDGLLPKGRRTLQDFKSTKFARLLAQFLSVSSLKEGNVVLILLNIYGNIL